MYMYKLGGLGMRLLFIPADMKFNCGMICTHTGNQALFLSVSVRTGERACQG